MRMIDADELMEHIWRDKLDSRELIANLVKRMPTIKNDRGHWLRVPIACYVYGTYGTIIEYECSECAKHQTIEYNFCPNCGAYMITNNL